MDSIIIVNLILCVVVLILNTGAITFFFRAKAEGGYKLIKILLLLFTCAIELVLAGILFDMFLRGLGIREDTIRIVNNTNSFFILSILLITELILIFAVRVRNK